MKAEATKARKKVMTRKMRAQVGKLPTAYRNKISTHKKVRSPNQDTPHASTKAGCCGREGSKGANFTKASS